MSRPFERRRGAHSSSVASAAASAESLSAARSFLAEIDVLVERRLDRIGDQLHVVACEHVAVPRLHAEPGASSQRRTEHQGKGESTILRRHPLLLLLRSLPCVPISGGQRLSYRALVLVGIRELESVVAFGGVGVGGRTP